MLPFVLVAAAVLCTTFFGVQFSVREYVALFAGRQSLPTPFTALLDPPARPSLAAATTTVLSVVPRVIAVINGTLTPPVEVTAPIGSGPSSGGAEVPGISLWLLCVACAVSFLLGALFAVTRNGTVAQPVSNSGDGDSKPLLDIGNLVLTDALPSPVPTDLTNPLQFSDISAAILAGEGNDTLVELLISECQQRSKLEDQAKEAGRLSQKMSQKIALLTAENESLILQAAKSTEDARKSVERAYKYAEMADKSRDRVMTTGIEHIKENAKLKEFQAFYGVQPHQIETFKQNVKDLTLKHKTLERQHESLRWQKEKLTKKVEDLRRDFNVRRVKEERATAVAELKEAEAKKESLKNETDHLIATKAKLEAELKDVRETKKATRMAETNASLLRRLDDVQQERNSLKEGAKTLEKERDDLRVENESLADDVSRLEKSNAELFKKVFVQPASQQAKAPLS